ncbi:MAG: methylenetetrahydrofolate reductase [Promethearchaeota archaeon]
MVEMSPIPDEILDRLKERPRRPAYSSLARHIQEGKFVFTGELEPVKTVGVEELIHSATAMKEYIIAANVTDGPQGMAYFSGLAASFRIQEATGVEVVYQMTVRDRNRVALTADVLGAAQLGIKNILTLSGDHTALGDNYGARPVYDLDSAQFVWLLSRIIDEGVDAHGNRITGKVEMNVGMAANPMSTPMEAEILKIERKVLLGADFVQTQTMYDVELTKEFLKATEYLRVPILIGIFPVKNYGIAAYFNKYIPGVSVPEPLFSELKRCSKIADKKERNAAYDRVNLEFFEPFIKEIRKTTKAAGIHCMAVHYERLMGPLRKAVDSA